MRNREEFIEDDIQRLVLGTMTRCDEDELISDVEKCKKVGFRGGHRSEDYFDRYFLTNS